MTNLIATDNGTIITDDGNVNLLLSEANAAGDIQQFDCTVDLEQALIWQYTNATTLKALIDKKQSWYEKNHCDFWIDWQKDVFDLRTANEFGLSVWSIILGLPLFTNSPPDPLTKATFGFDSSFYTNFDNGNFSNFGSGSSYNLPIETKRIALQLRCFQIISSGCVPETNRMLKFLFGAFGGAYLLDKGYMQQTYVFKFALSADLRYIFDAFDLLPRPACVKSNYIDVNNKFFGFAPYGLNFDNGNFGA
jgi:Protein of unknown function (DUF2612)